MPLADDLGGLQPDNRRGTRCTTGERLNALPDADRQAVLDALARGIPATTVSEVLKAHGVNIAAGSLLRHTKGRCQCPTSAND